MFDSASELSERDVASRYLGDGTSAIEDWMASGEILPAQLPLKVEWSPCKKLAASVLASALVEVRDHAHDPAYQRRIAEDLDWIRSDEVEWPFSFLRICDLLGMEAEWVRSSVDRWLSVPPSGRKRPVTPYRQAA